MIWLALLQVAAFATPGFDPTRPAARFTGPETFTLEGDVKLWSAIERLEDPDRTLFQPESFNRFTEWPASATWAPGIKTCFGTARPASHLALLHLGPSEEVATGTPILMIHGAGDNASRSFVTMATRYDRKFRPIYAITFAHPHGDVFMQAEWVANAIARIKARTGAAQVDVVAHSKGGAAAAVYLANAPGTDWGHAAYNAVGTRYRGDVRKAVFIAAPLDGIDTAYRWPAANGTALDADDALSPTSWSAYYPLTTGNLFVVTDMKDQDFHADGADLFPGHRQLLKRQAPSLPGSRPSLGVYALQQDWYTTYEGGYGFYSYSQGIDAAIAEGGNLVDRVARQGVDPGVQLYLVAGNNPLMPNGSSDFTAEFFGGAWSDTLNESQEAWGAFVADLVGDGLLDKGFTQAEIKGLASGKLVLGEISGESDGLVFVDSALRASNLTQRGARVVDTYTANLSHVDLLYASPITGQLLIDASDDNPANGWMAAVGARYIEADTLGWVERALQDPEEPGDTDDPGDTGDTDDPGDTGGGADTDDSVDTDGPPQLMGCEGCTSINPTPAGAALVLVLAGVGLLFRRKRATT
jgi:uncharacterized protein (TIGR03382 family)